MSADIDPRRARELEKLLENEVREGERFVVRADARGVEVTPHQEERDGFFREHPDLHGELLSVNEVVSNAGTTYLFLVLAAVLSLCLTVANAWIDDLFGIDVHRLLGFWFYALVVVTGFFVFVRGVEYLERRAFLKRRRSLVDAAGTARLTRNRLLALIEGDRALNDVAERLKRHNDW